jgi:predicted secreted Zn-dependent protease
LTGVVLADAARAQGTVVVRTNFYVVSGTTARELRQSIHKSNPWKALGPMDGRTDWRMEWRLGYGPAESGCRLHRLDLTTIITLTLPRWNPPPDALPELRVKWANYLKALTLHEEGHKRNALAAAAAAEKLPEKSRTYASCRELAETINKAIEKLVAAHRQKDLDYDRETQHGQTQGARFP